MKYKWLLFDADGTLFDYEKAEASALERTFEYFHLRYEPVYRSIYQRINHQLWLEFEQGLVSSEALRIKRFEIMQAEIGAQFVPCTFSDQYIIELANASELMEGAHEVVHGLRSRYQLGLITNGLRDVQRPRLERSTLRDSFSVFVISDEVGVAKPDRAIFDIAFREMGYPANDQVLIIGDSLSSDIQGGSNYGIDTCWFNPSHLSRNIDLPITYEISRLTELIGILQ